MDPGVVYKGLLDLMMRSSFPVPRRDLDCARCILPCAEDPLRRDLSRPDSRFARRLRGTSPSWKSRNDAQPQAGQKWSVTIWRATPTPFLRFQPAVWNIAPDILYILLPRVFC